MAVFLVSLDYEDDDHYLDLEVWLEYDGPDARTITQEQVEAVFREIVSSGVIPDGWTVELVEWTHGKAEHHGTVTELGDFDAVVRSSELGIEMHLEQRPPELEDEDEDGGGE